MNAKVEDILKQLNIDINNPEAVAGAREATSAILMSRRGGGGGGGQPIDVPVDPNLLQPSRKHQSNNNNKADITDKDDILSKVQRKSDKLPSEKTEDTDDEQLNKSGDKFKDADKQKKIDQRDIQRQRTLELAKNALEKAEEQGASENVKNRIEQAIDELTKAATKLDSMTDEAFNDLINNALDAVESIMAKEGTTFKSDAELKADVERIKQELSDKDVINTISAEDRAAIRAEVQEVRAKKLKRELIDRDSSTLRGFEAFLASLTTAVKNQVIKTFSKDKSWTAFNRKYDGTGMLLPGQKKKEVGRTKIPSIDFYFDISGSWTSDDLKIGQKAVDMIKKYEEEGKLEIHILYFGNEISPVKNRNLTGSGTSAWGKIIDNIIVSRPRNVVIMTDSDMNSWGDHSKKAIVEGYVWYLWKNGLRAPNLLDELQGVNGTFEYKFETQ